MFRTGTQDRIPYLGIAVGALVALLAARIAPPLVARAGGALLAQAGRDPLAALARDHRRLLALIGAMEAMPGAARGRRAAMLFQLKRMLAAHSMAEEDVIYPMLVQDAGREKAVRDLYHEHAEMKLALFALEHLAQNAPSWLAKLRELRRLIARHARQEEEEEFPKLRAALSQAETGRLGGELQREKAMIL